MDSISKWNIIVDRYEQLRNKKEDVIQKEWESYCSEIFDYKLLLGEIDAQRSMQIGSRERVIPDIILKLNDKDVIDIELKQYDLEYDNSMENQLKSYLRLLGVSVGIIVCKNIYLCYYDIINDDFKKVSISFIKNNPMGVKFIDLLHKESFDSDKVKTYVCSYVKSKENIKLIQNELSETLIKQLLKEYFIKKYNEDEIESVLEKNKIIIKDGAEEVNSVSVDPVVDGFPKKPEFIIIKTTDNRVRDCKGSLYDATRHCWRIRYEKALNYNYVLSVINQQVREVYFVKTWRNAERWENDYKDITGRLEFVGDVAPEDIRQLFIGKIIPYKYRKPGMASPVVFSDC